MNYTLQINSNILTIIPSEALTPNREYLITIDPYVSGSIPPSGDIEVLQVAYSFWFTSTYCPLFTTLNRIKLLVGPSADVLLDDSIYRMIHKNSLDIVELFNLSRSTNYAYDYWGCDWQGAPIIFKRYVECKTAYDVLALLKQINSAGGGNQLKTLGDMTIKYGEGSPSSSSLDSPSRAKELYECWNEALRGIESLNCAVKGYYDSSKGFSHPVRERQHNRVIRPVIRNTGFGNKPSGPWEKGYYWQRFDTI